jgi:ferrous iron transport protein B
LVGNPNVGKTTLFNRLCGLRAKTANFPGSTVDARVGTAQGPHGAIDVVDLPGVYALDLELPESKLCRECLAGQVEGCRPDAAIVVLDATNLLRGLQFLASVASSGLPVVVAVTMGDIAARRGLSIDATLLRQHVGCPVVAVSGRTGEGLDRLLGTVPDAAPFRADLAPGESVAAWAARAIEESVGGARALGKPDDSLSDRLDEAFTHPLVGSLIFAGVMAALFLTIFTIAEVPMTLLEEVFGRLAAGVRGALPEGAVADLLADGVIGGIAGTLVFLPQICLLFFLLSLLEDTGYLARAAFVMDRIMCRFGLPGQAFVPLLSSHACALPGIMSARLIPDRHDRLATILVAPFMSCSARVPVYVLLTSLLFPASPLLAGLAFMGCYVLGAGAALLSAAIFRRTILRGQSRAMVLELPGYKWPSLRVALATTYERAMTFLKNAGTIILAICIVMWWLSAYPKSPPAPEAIELRAQAAQIEASDASAAEAMVAAADALDHRQQQSGSFAGRIGSAVEPVFAPLGFDRQLTVSVLTAFLAREVFVSTTAVLIGSGDDVHDQGVVDSMAAARRDDGTPLFTVATSVSLLVFFVLAMQCLPTLAVTRRETGSWKWAGVQLVWMSGLAYAAALLAHVALRAGGVA